VNTYQEDQVEVCMKFLETECKKRKTINLRHTSYGLKHKVEAWSKKNWPNKIQKDTHTGEEFVGARYYVSNESFIEAARRSGYKMKLTHVGSPNYFFNIHCVGYYDE
jgi:hypothetical protein